MYRPDLLKSDKIKGYLSQKYRIVYPGAVYHITQRAPGADKMFLEENDYLYMLHLLKEKSEKFKLDIFTYSLLPNHIHAEPRINEENLSIAIKNILETYAINFNKKYEREGHVVCRRFWSSLCLDESYLIAVSLYIHINPYKAGLVKDPREYPWSSCSLYTNPKSPKSFVNYKFILGLIDEDIQEAKKKYNDLLMEAMDLEVDSITEDAKAVISFKNKIQKKIKKIIGPIKENNLYTDDDLVEEIQKFREKKRLRSPKELKARKYLIKQLQSRGFSISEIAKKLNISRQATYDTLNLTK